MSTFIERLLKGKAGSVVTVEPDYVIINDGVSHSAVDDISSVRYPERVLVIYDHDVPTGRPEAATILKNNLTFADEYGCNYIQAQGVGYQYMLNEIVKHYTEGFPIVKIFRDRVRRSYYPGWSKPTGLASSHFARRYFGSLV